MSEKIIKNEKLLSIGELFLEKRKALGPSYKSRLKFIDKTSIELFAGEEWISERYLASIEEGKNWIGFEKFIQLSIALQQDTVQLFAEMLEVYLNS